MKHSTLFLLSVLVLGFYSAGHLRTEARTLRRVEQFKERSSARPGALKAAPKSLDARRYRLDAAQSRFIVRTFSGGLLWFKGHDHFIAVRDFTGEAQLAPDLLNPASLQFTIRADSLVETRDVFTEQQKQIINREIRELVLETAKYPEIVFKSTEVKGKLAAGGQFDVRIGGELTLHGVTRHITIPASVMLNGNDLRARGEFFVNRSDYNVKATSALHGTIRVRDKLKFTFDIVAHQS